MFSPPTSLYGHGVFILPAGLDSVLQPYVPVFVLAGIGGQRLLMLSNMDLEKLGMFKVGHQEMLLQAVNLICDLVRHLFLFVLDRARSLILLTVPKGLNIISYY